jgi:hypothetical protein
VEFFSGVRVISFCIRLSSLACIQSVVRERIGSCVLWSLTVWLAKVIKNFISAAPFLRLCKAVKVQFSDPYKNVGKTKVLYNFNIVSVLAFLKILLLILSIKCRNFASLSSTSL